MANADRLHAEQQKGAGRGLLIALLILIMIIAAGAVLVLRLNQRLVEAEVASRLAPIEEELRAVKPVLEQIKSVENSVQALREAAADLENDPRFARISSRQEVLEQKVGADYQSLTDSLGRLTEMQQRLESAVERLNSEFESVQTITDDLEQLEQGMQKDLSAVTAGLREVEQNLARHQGIMRDLQERLQRSKSGDEVEEALAAINTRLKEWESRFNSRVLSLEGKAGTIERRLDALERQLLQLQSQPSRP